MAACKFYQFLIRFLPLTWLKDWAIRHHAEACPVCTRKLAQKEEVVSLLPLPTKPEKAQILWLRIHQRLEQERTQTEPSPRPRVRLKWAAAGLSFCLVLIVSLFFIFYPEKKKPQAAPEASEVHFQIIRFQVKDRPAAPVIYKPFGSQLIFIWAQSPKNNSIN